MPALLVTDSLKSGVFIVCTIAKLDRETRRDRDKLEDRDKETGWERQRDRETERQLFQIISLRGLRRRLLQNLTATRCLPRHADDTNSRVFGRTTPGDSASAENIKAFIVSGAQVQVDAEQLEHLRSLILSQQVI